MDVKFVSVACFFISVLVYSNTFNAGFVYDDNRAILTNPDVTQLSDWTKLFGNDFWGTPLGHSGSHQSYRPITVLTFRLNHHLFGLQPSSYHVINDVIHALTTVLFCHVTRSLLNFQSDKVLVAGLLFSTHPIHTEAVAGLVGRSDLLSTFFLLSALLLYKLSCDQSDETYFHGIPCKQPSSHPTKVKTISSSKKRKKKRRKRHNRPSYDVTSPNVPDMISEFDSGKETDSNESMASTSSTSDDVTTDCADVKPILRNRKATTNPIRRHNAGFNNNKKFPTNRLMTSWICYVIVVLLFILSLLSKEQGYCALIICSVYDVWIRHNLGVIGALKVIFFKDSSRKQLRLRIWMNFILTFVILSIRLHISSLTSGNFSTFPGFSASDNPSASNEDPRCRVMTFNFLIFFNFFLFIFPHQLSYDWSMDSIPLLRDASDPRNLGTIFFYILLLFSLKRSWDFLRSQDSSSDEEFSSSDEEFSSFGCGRSDEKIPEFETKYRRPITEIETSQKDSDYEKGQIFGLMLTMLTFLPASNLFFYVGFVVAERVLYLPTIGLIVISTQLLFKLKDRVSTRFGKTSYNLFVLSIIITLAYRSWLRNFDWNDELALYSSGVDVNPAKSWGNLGNVYREKGLRHKAEEAYVTALRHRPNMADVHYNLGLLYQEAGRLVEAERSYNDSISFRPSHALARLNLGVLMTQQGRNEEAKKIYRQMAHLSDAGLRNPRSYFRAQTSAFYNLGILLADEGDHVQAVSAYQKAVKTMPIDYKPHGLYNMLGQSLFVLDKLKEAEVFYRKSLSSKPDHVTTHLTYARFLDHVGRFDQSESLYLKALQLEPSNQVPCQHYSNFLSTRGRYVAAAEVMVDCGGGDGGWRDYDVVFNTANKLREAKMFSEAEKFYRRAVHLQPGFASSHMNLGAILHILGKYPEARLSYLRALEIRPDDVTILENLSKLDQAERR